jgi:hypothetical protein
MKGTYVKVIMDSAQKQKVAFSKWNSAWKALRERLVLLNRLWGRGWK